MKILVFGLGYLGSYLNEKFSDLINSTDPEYVINCAGLVSVELSEKDAKASYQANVQVVLDLIKKYPKSKLINFSSYYVYDSPGECTEFSKTTDEYVYMKYKILSEKYSLRAGGSCFRIGKLFGHPDLSRQSRLTEHIIKSKEPIILDDVEFNPTSLETIADVLKYELENKTLHGLYNLSDDGTTTHFLYGKYILEKLDLKTEIKHVDKINKSFHNYGNFKMSIERIKKIIPIKHWTYRMNEYLKLLKGRKCIA